VQFNADKRYVEFIFDKPAKNKQQKQSETSGEIPKVIRGKTLTHPERENLKNGKTIYIDGFISKAGSSYTGYLNYNTNSGKIDFSFKNPNKQDDTVGQETSKNKVKKSEETPKKAKGVKM
jgi:hypothetical protein